MLQGQPLSPSSLTSIEAGFLELPPEGLAKELGPKQLAELALENGVSLVADPLDDDQHPPVKRPCTHNSQLLVNDLFDPFNILVPAPIHEPLQNKSQHTPCLEGLVTDQGHTSTSAGLSGGFLHGPRQGVLPDVPGGMESVDTLATHIPLWPTWPR